MSRQNHRVLRGLKGLRIVVEEIDHPNAPTIEARLQRNAERQLAAADIPLLELERWLRTPGAPYLYINITATRLPERGLRSFCIDVELHQQAYMARAPEVAISTCTWEQGLIDMVPAEKLPGELDSALTTLIAGFISDYQNAQGEAISHDIQHSSGLQFN